MDTPPPSSSLPPQQPLAYPPPKKSSGCGCFAGGCLSVFVAAAFGLVLLFVCGWFVFSRALNSFTSNAPTEITVTVPSEAEYAEANAKFEQFRDAVRRDQTTTIAFTAADLNALIARHPDFASQRGRVHVSIDGTVATVEMSVPLKTVPLMKHRWFNGSTRFTFSYEDHDFVFDPEWIEANGHHFTNNTLSSFTSSFNRRFTTSFRDSMEENGAGKFWESVKSMTLQDGQLIITTRGEPGSSV